MEYLGELLLAVFGLAAILYAIKKEKSIKDD